MASALCAKMADYFARFNRADEELYPNAVRNDQAYDFLLPRIPRVELPDEVIERAYYFRWWTFRKHLRKTPEGWIVTEFLPDVSWSGAYNSINCAAGFHLREGRWMNDPEIIPQCMDFWLDRKGDSLRYSSWVPTAIGEYCEIHGPEAALSRLPKMAALTEDYMATRRTETPLYRSTDNRDGMEYSISGPGLRPTMNSYLCADHRTLARYYRLAGDIAEAERHETIAQELLTQMDALLWDGDFYRTIPDECIVPGLSLRPEVPEAHRARELVGYVPWYFDLPAPGKEACFRELFDPQGFATPYGLTTAEQRHPRYMEQFSHECLWNGPIWPYATAQTLVAAANVLHREHQEGLTREQYTFLLHQYAASHRRTLPDGTQVDWIDENMSPVNGEWLARRILEEWGWREDKGGYERGKDYNHSLFCDLVLSGLLGIGADEEGALRVRPLIPESWPYFRVENLCFRGKIYDLVFDRDGSRYGLGKGLHILPQ